MTLTKYNPFDVEDFIGTMNHLFADSTSRPWALKRDSFGAYR